MKSPALYALIVSLRKAVVLFGLIMFFCYVGQAVCLYALAVMADAPMIQMARPVLRVAGAMAVVVLGRWVFDYLQRLCISK